MIKFSQQKVEDLLILGIDTVDGRNPGNHPGCIKPCKQWDKLPSSTGERRISAVNSRLTFQNL